MLVKGRPRHQREHGRRSWSGLRSRPCGQCWHKHLRSGSPVADRGMRAHGIVVTAPAFDDDLGFAQRVEDLAVEQLVAQARVEAFDEAVLPWENGFIKSFNARLRDELLDGEIFYTLREAQIVIESWRRHYNAVRPHASIGYRAPAPEVFVPALAAWPAAQPRPAPPAMLPLVPRPTLN